jgi:hypothetical protein
MSCLAAGRDLLLVIGVLTMLLVLGLVGSGLADPEPSPKVVTQGPYQPARTIVPSTTRASPFVVEEHLSRELASHPGHPLASRPANVVVSIDDDPREYLRKMAVLQRRLSGQDSPPDPYQASLNPAVYVGYFTIDATPIAHVCSAILSQVTSNAGSHNLLIAL